MLVFAMFIVGKNSQVGVKIHEVGTSDTVTSRTIKFLCINIFETLLHATLERRAEISADIFARLLRYVSLSCKNLTIILDIF